MKITVEVTPNEIIEMVEKLSKSDKYAETIANRVGHYFEDDFVKKPDNTNTPRFRMNYSH